jgi:hypothetical protein
MMDGLGAGLASAGAPFVADKFIHRTPSDFTHSKLSKKQKKILHGYTE